MLVIVYILGIVSSDFCHKVSLKLKLGQGCTGDSYVVWHPEACVFRRAVVAIDPLILLVAFVVGQLSETIHR